MFQKDFPLAPLTTFGINAKAAWYTEVKTSYDLLQLIADPVYASVPERLVLGGGSNLLFTRNFKDLVIHNRIGGLHFKEENEQSVFVKAGSGEIWHDLVMACVQKNFGGIENLALIPGTVGASPVQNIGAYGVELKDVFVSLEAFDLDSGEMVHFEKDQCRFGYRDSIFKQEAKGKYFITSVSLRLKKAPFQKLNLNYGAIQHVLQEMEVQQPTISDICEAVMQIRRSKLPDPKVIGNAGSFFKNPEVAISKCQELLDEYPLMPTYPVSNVEHKKIAAGWLIEQCGWKGKKWGNAAVHSLQALVLTNPGNASGEEVKRLAEEIQHSVLEKFGVVLETEVNII